MRWVGDGSLMNAANQRPSVIRSRLSHLFWVLPMPHWLHTWRRGIYGRKQMHAVLEQVARQKSVDERLRLELSSTAHSFEDPLVIVDPYGDSPLTAVVLFRTSRPSAISVCVTGKDAACTVEFSFDGFHEEHLIPVYGLHAGAENEVTLAAKDVDGTVVTRTLRIRTAELHPALSRVHIDVLKFDAARSNPGLTFVFQSTPKFAFDAAGDIRWILDLPTTMATLYDFRGNILATSGDYLGQSLLYEIDLLGRIHCIGETPYGAHHDIQEIDGGKLLITGSGTGRTVKDLLYEYDLDEGKVIRILDFRNILDPTRPSIDGSGRDWLHLNGVAWSAADHAIYVSGRNQSAVVKLSYPRGTIEWILADHDNWLPDYMRYLLTPQGKGFAWPHGLHSPVILPDQDGDPDTVDVMLFDNHSFMDTRAREAVSESRHSRLVQYRVNGRAGTVEQVWEFGSEFGHDLFTHHCGFVDYLPDGNILSLFNLSVGHRTGYFRVIELAHDARDVVFDAVIYSTDHDLMPDYRCARRSPYSASDRDPYPLEPCIENVSEVPAGRPGRE